MMVPQVLAIQICHRNATSASYDCGNITASTLELLDLPVDSCQAINCEFCITGTRTYILHQNSLLHPAAFFEKPTNADGILDTFLCSTADTRGDMIPLPCECSTNCSGTADFCSNFPCVDEAPCRCKVRKVLYEMSHLSSTGIIVNPTLISLQVCLFKIPKKTRRSRQLQEYEGATFSNHNLSISFQDPIVTLPEPGKLIARVSGNELILSIQSELQVVLPPEFVAFRDTLTLIFISNSGKAVHGDISLEGKTVCRLSGCILCRDFLFYIKCWPAYITYLFYGTVTIFVLSILCLLKWACKGILISLRSVILLILTTLAFIKSLLRFFLLVGALLGTTIRNYILSFHQFLENRNPQRRPAMMHSILLFLSLLALTQADCSTHALLSSDIKNCQKQTDHQTCQLFTTAEITLKGLGYESCIWFQDKNDNDIFHMKLKLVSAQCSFSSKRKYFTFPVKHYTISQLACPQNYYCAWGEHCKNDKHFEALTEESLEYPGFTSCQPSSVGSGCTIISRMGCLFYRVYFIPDLLHSYEVRQLSGHQCTYTISVERSLNNTVETMTFHSSTITADGINIDILGAYNQAPIHISDSLLLRVGDASEAYLVPSSPSNRPIAGLVGQVQANTSYTTNFLFDRNMVQCTFFETTLRCMQTPDALEALYATNERALPLTHDLHLLSMEKGTLKSQLLSSAPVRLQLHFQDYKITVQSIDICPRLTDAVFKTKGCYACQILSEMTFFAFSSCHAGTISLEFQKISIYTRSINLGTEPQEYSIKFLADEKCYDEKICLVSRNMRQCQKISFCLSEPSLHLIQLNTSYTKSFSKSDSSGSGFFSFFSLPTFNNVFMSLKMLGAILLIVCLTITIFSTCVTCCRR